MTFIKFDSEEDRIKGVGLLFRCANSFEGWGKNLFRVSDIVTGLLDEKNIKYSVVDKKL